ncbi:hypothetical protein Cs7R123_44890 [Catellatospora sp. TT07R-123]|uniref:4Fe-4S single cluster domain-containing protein n=1 Tax=Catellatospora sp. TT07R-123 TaxID=2733863 RepID=UPI001B26EFCC|nr:4Fe-4S single cluster domain-containing protein [Catellatospora sp. TT07R-123]GHJ47147.1 hypothetical protein Cs7R123_44890 [Catellatospora sp. TT07R-123]
MGDGILPDIVNVAATCVGTAALGPGHRSVVWVQGCPFDCPGCLAPDWIPQRQARLVDAETLAEELLSDAAVDGLTLSGGEPMGQASGLAATVRAARRRRELSVICFTGFRLEALRRRPPGPGVEELLAEVDVLIDGPYRADRNDGVGLRGSDNQQIHHLTDRLAGFDLGSGPRRAEVRLRGREALIVGVPPAGLQDALEQAVAHAGANRVIRGDRDT